MPPSRLRILPAPPGKQPFGTKRGGYFRGMSRGSRMMLVTIP